MEWDELKWPLAAEADVLGHVLSRDACPLAMLAKNRKIDVVPLVGIKGMWLMQTCPWSHGWGACVGQLGTEESTWRSVCCHTILVYIVFPTKPCGGSMCSKQLRAETSTRHSIYYHTIMANSDSSMETESMYDIYCR